jgi:hypothetical protein
MLKGISFQNTTYTWKNSIMSVETFQELSRILETDLTDNTYKYALLRAVSEICQKYPHLLKIEDNVVWFPTGLIVEKWLLYYWPIFENEKVVPQMPERYLRGRRLRLSFRNQFQKIITYYCKGNGLSQFYNEYLNNEIPPEINDQLLDLMKKIRYSITRYPMKHLGYSVFQKHYPIFNFVRPDRIPRQPVSRELLIEKFGKFSIPLEYYHVFRDLGGFIIGDQSTLTQWAKLTEKFTNKQPDFSEVYNLLTEEPITERQVQKIKSYYENLLIDQGKIKCIWSGRSITSVDQVDIDHMIPFSKWKNNDLWNLVPTHSHVNAKKKDRIPSLKLLEKRKKNILEHWRKVESKFPQQFISEIKLSLVGYEETQDLKDTAFSSLLEKVDFLINSRKYSYWDG